MIDITKKSETSIFDACLPSVLAVAIIELLQRMGNITDNEDWYEFKQQLKNWLDSEKNEESRI
jgi:hypothetical protein